MAGRGPAPKPDGQRHGKGKGPERSWKYAEGSGWRHGPVPPPPSKLLGPSKDAWASWFGAWFAWFWEPEDVPALRHLVRLYDQVERGEYQRHAELRLAMDTYGITPKGQQDRRWQPAKADELEQPAGVTVLDDYRDAFGG